MDIESEGGSCPGQTGEVVACTLVSIHIFTMRSTTQVHQLMRCAIQTVTMPT